MSDEVFQAVADAVAAVCHAKGVVPPAFTHATPVDGALGLDSLDFTEVITRLEGTFGFDPFSTGAVDQLATLGDLADLYRRA